MKTIEKRVSALEESLGPVETGVEYDNRADYDTHVHYVVKEDDTVIVIDSGLSRLPGEQALWAAHPRGKKFLRIGGGETAEIIDGVTKPVRFRPVKPSREMEELYFDIVGERPEWSNEVAP